MQLLSGTRVELFSETLFFSWDNGQLPVAAYTPLSWKISNETSTWVALLKSA